MPAILAIVGFTGLCFAAASLNGIAKHQRPGSESGRSLLVNRNRFNAVFRTADLTEAGLKYRRWAICRQLPDQLEGKILIEQ
jgi:hypothetical protein